MHKQILEHLTLYERIQRAKLPWSVLEYGNSQEVVQVCNKVIDMQIEQAASQMPEEVIQYLFGDKDFIDKIHILLEEEISVEGIIVLISGAGNEPLSRYDGDVLKEVLSDEVIWNSVRFLYLKYYYMYDLTEQQKRFLNSGLDFLVRHMKVQLDDLEEPQRKLFYEPILSSNLLNDVVTSKEDIQELLNPEMLLLLNELNEHLTFHYSLGKVQWNQLRKEPEIIRKDLMEVLPQIKSEDISQFLVLWLENESLRYDMNRLKKEIPKKSEEERHQMTRTNASYISVIYGGSIEGIPLEGLVKDKEKLLIYAITNRKKHFLSLIKEHFDDFRALAKYSLLFDPDVYRNFLNINTMNEKDFKSCFTLKQMGKEEKQFMVNPSYLFSELAVMAGMPSVYVKLFHKLRYQRSDDRLRVYREIVKKKCLSTYMDEDEIEGLGNMLSQKPLSKWMQEEFAHISGIYPEDTVQVLSHWEQMKRFVPDVKDRVQVRYLLSNEKVLNKYKDFRELHEQVLEKDKFWPEIRQKFQIKYDFIEENKNNICQFLYEGGAEVMLSFLKQQPEKKEKIRRILMAELMGRFGELKYHKDDLQREIDFPVSETVNQIWQENSKIMENGIQLWEEDKMLPTMRIGEVPEHTCLSYKNGAYNECLLSCFDSNKKVMQAYTDGKIVFRAIIRITKGCFIHIAEENESVEFVDLTEQPKESKREKTVEELVLFLERPYFRWVSEEKKNEILILLCKLLKKKAEKLGARLVISASYSSLGMSEKNFVLSGYSLYISASKNGSQYIDSIGGKASVSDSRSYGWNRFWVANKEDESMKAA